jgi:hypothetical protein
MGIHTPTWNGVLMVRISRRSHPYVMDKQVDFFIVTQWGHNQQPILRDGNHQSISMEIKNNNFLLATMGTLCFRLVVFSSAGALADCSFQKV